MRYIPLLAAYEDRPVLFKLVPMTKDKQVADSTPANGDLNPRKVLMQGIYSVIVVFGLVGAGAFFLHDELTAVGTWFVESFGLLGVFVGVMLTDSVGIPIPPDTYLFAAVAAGSDALPVLVVTSVTSVTGGNLAYLIGTKLHKWPFLEKRMDLFRDRGEALMKRWGVWAVAIAAWTPIPFSVVCWFAGAYKMSYRRFLLATLHRAPRIVVYYYVIVLGWTAGAFNPPPFP